VKPQTIRILDVVLIGPLMAYAGKRLHEEEERAVGWTLGLLGVATIFYNGRNFLRKQEEHVGSLPA
jgi:hypothetical protein